MPRKIRFFLSDVPVHIIQRGHSRDTIFFEDQDYATYAHWVLDASDRCKVDVHAFVLMTNHFHLLVNPRDTCSTSRFV